jgi:hypothetical protein
MTSADIDQLMETAKWAGALSDTSDHELYDFIFIHRQKK